MKKESAARHVTTEVHSSQDSWFEPRGKAVRLRPGIGGEGLGGGLDSELLQ